MCPASTNRGCALDVARRPALVPTPAADARDGLDRLEHRRGPTEQLTPMTSAPAARGGKRGRRRAIQAVAVHVGRHLRDDGQRRHAADGLDRRDQLVQIAKGLEHEQVDAALGERRGLLAKRILGLGRAGAAPRLDPHAQRANRAGHPHAVAGGMTRNARALRVERLGLVGQTEVGQLEPVGAKGVRLDDVGARADVLAVHLGDQVGLRQVEFVETAIEKDALAIEHRPHRAVTDQHARIDGSRNPCMGGARAASVRPSKFEVSAPLAGTSMSALSKSLLL
jgi:hypothetical protein